MSEFEHFRVKFVALIVGALFQPGKKRGVFLVGEIVSRDMRGREFQGSFQGCLPLRQGLAWNGEHKVNADIFDPSFPEEGNRAFYVVWSVRSSQGLEDFLVKGLGPK